MYKSFGNEEPEDSYDKAKSEKLLFSSRLFITTMCFMGVLVMVTARLNMSVAIVCMVNHTATRAVDDVIKVSLVNGTFQFNGTASNYDASSDSRCGSQSKDSPKETAKADGPFLWSKQEQGTVLGAYFWGYVLSQIPSGWTVRRMGGVRMLGISSLASSALCLLIPLLAPYSFMAVAVLRAGIGFVAGMVCPSVHTLLSNWLPPTERAKMASFAYSGFSVGSLLTHTGSGFLCKYGFADGWQSIFFVFGGFGLLFSFAWYFLVSETPVVHKRISSDERRFIMSKMEGLKEEKTLSTPWKAILTSLPVQAILFSSIANDFFSIIMWLFLPSYLSDVMKLDISSNGVVSSLPYVLQFFMLLIAGFVSDAMLVKGWLSLSALRKLFFSLGSMLCIVSIIIVGFLDCQRATLAVFFIMVSLGGIGIMTLGYYVNPLDIAPAFSGLIIALANLTGTVTGIISPYIVAAITGENPSQGSWQIVFCTTAALLTVSMIVYAIFASGDIQPWALGSSRDMVRPHDIEMDIPPDCTVHSELNGTSKQGESHRRINHHSAQNQLLE